MHAKKFKRLFAMLLAIVTIVSCLAFSASAATSTTKTETAGYVGTSSLKIPCCWKKWVTTGTVNGTLTSFNTIGRNSSNRYYCAEARNSKPVTKIVATYEAVKNSTGATLDKGTKSANNSSSVKADKWVYSGATYEICNFTVTETRAANSYAEYITHIY